MDRMCDIISSSEEKKCGDILSSNRDDFSEQTKQLLAKRVGYRCSNPNCQKPTSGSNLDPNKATNIGVAAHICAAAPRGPRYDPAFWKCYAGKCSE